MSELEQSTMLGVWRHRSGDPKFGHGYVRLAELLMSSGRDDEALAVLEHGIEGTEPCHGALLQLGVALLARGRDIEARSHLLRLLAQDPENTKALALLADHARESGRWDEASRFYLRLTELEPQNKLWNKMLLMVRERANSGLGSTAEVDRWAGKQPMSTMTLVDIYLAQGYRDRALAVLREMVAADGTRTDAIERISEIENGLAPDISGSETREGLVAPGNRDGLPAAPDAERLAHVRQQASQRRSADKLQFQTWVDYLRKGSEQ